LVHTTEPDNLRGIPLGRIRAACTMRGAGGIVLAIAMRIDEEIASSELSTRPPGGAAIERRYVLQRPAGKILGDDFYRDVAHAYESCVALGLSPNKTIATDVGVQISSVAASVQGAPPQVPAARRTGQGDRLMPSTWISKRPTSKGEQRYRVFFRIGGRDSTPRHGGTFKTKAEAQARVRWISGESAAMPVPDISALRVPERPPTVSEVARRWQDSRIDVAPSTRVLHDVALRRIPPLIGDRPARLLTPAEVAETVQAMHGANYARGSIEKSLAALRQALDHADIDPKSGPRSPRQTAAEGTRRGLPAHRDAGRGRARVRRAALSPAFASAGGDRNARRRT